MLCEFRVTSSFFRFGIVALLLVAWLHLPVVGQDQPAEQEEPDPMSVGRYSQAALDYALAANSFPNPVPQISWLLFDEMDASTKIQIEEDVNILAKVIWNELPDSAKQSSSLSDFRPSNTGGEMTYYLAASSLSSAGSKWFSVRYIDDYGLWYKFNVNFPVVGQEEKTEEDNEKPEKERSAWEVARSQLKKPKRPRVSRNPWTATLSRTAAYDSKRVKALFEGILKGLKEANNVRNMASDDYLVVSVEGTGGAVGKTHASIRIRKSDAEELADGRIEWQDFKERAERSTSK